MYFYLCFIYFCGILLSKGDLAHAQPEKIEAFAGGHAILPCSLKIPASDHVPTVEWSKDSPNSSIVFLYRDGCETFGMKNVDFEFRASLFMEEVKNGNVSLRISNLRLSDAGTYECLIIQSDKTRQTTRVELVVAAVSDLKLSVVFEEKEVVAVTCDASCQLPPPIIIIQDDEGNDIADKEPSQQEDTRGCCATRQNFSMQEGNRRVVCRVKQPQTDINRTAEILLSNKASCKGSNIIAIFGAVGGTSFFWFLIFLIWRKCHKNAEKKPNRKKSLDSTSISFDSLSLLTPASESNTPQRFIENLKNEATDLRSISSRKYEIICELQEDMRSLGDVYLHDKPTTVQSFSESSQDFPGSPKESLFLNSVTSNNVADRNLMKKSSKQSKDVQQRQISNSTHCRVFKRTQGHSSTSKWITQSGSGLAAGGNQKRNANSASSPLIDPDHNVSIVHRRYSSWPSSHSHSSNRYSLLANLPEQ